MKRRSICFIAAMVITIGEVFGGTAHATGPDAVSETGVLEEVNTVDEQPDGDHEISGAETTGNIAGNEGQSTDGTGNTEGNSGNDEAEGSGGSEAGDKTATADEGAVSNESAENNTENVTNPSKDSSEDANSAGDSEIKENTAEETQTNEEQADEEKKEESASEEGTDKTSTSGENEAEGSENGESADNESGSEEPAEAALPEGEEDSAVEEGAEEALEPEVKDSEPGSKDTYTEPFSYEEDIDGFHISLSAPVGVLPDGVSVSVEPLDDTEEEAAKDDIDDLTEREVFETKSFDITFFNSEKEEIQPLEGAVDISIDVSRDMVIRAEELGVDNIAVFHLADEGGNSKVDSEFEESGEDILYAENFDTDVYYTEEGSPVEKLVPIPDSAQEGEETHKMSVSFAADSFSVYSLALAASYTFNETSSNGETLIFLDDSKALANDFGNYVKQAFSTAANKATASNKYRVKLATGNYELNTSVLALGNNTTWDLGGSYITNKSEGGMITGKNTQKVKVKSISGYKGFSNMAVVNGTLDANTFNLSGAGFTTMKFAHVTGVTVENVTFLNSRGHAIEIAAAKDVSIKNCRFEHYSYPGDANDELVNIDYTRDGWISWSTENQDLGPYDDYGCENVEISGCIFNDMYRAIGSHNSILGRYHSNVSIHDNVFTNVSNYVIGGPHYTNTRVYNNNISGCGRGIDFYTETWAVFPSDYEDNKDPNYTADVSIYNNTLTQGGSTESSSVLCGIRVGGMQMNGSNCYTSGFSVTGNTLNGFESGVYACYTKDTEISGNIANSCQKGFDINGASEISAFNSNAVNSSTNTGILVRETTRLLSTEGNSVNVQSGEVVDIQDSSAAAIYVDAPKFLIGIGEIFKPKLYSGDADISYSSSKKSAVKVTQSGKVKGLKKGTVTITASQEGCNGSVKISAKKAPTSVKIKKKKTLKVGATYQLTPKVNKGSACEKYKFKSHNKKVAKVSADGLITAKKKGTAIITVTAYNGVSADITIKVK